MVLVALNEKVTKEIPLGIQPFIIFVLARLCSYVVSYLVV